MVYRFTYELCSVQYRNTVWVYQSKRLSDRVVQYKTNIISLLLKHVYLSNHNWRPTLLFALEFRCLLLIPKHQESKNKLYQTYFKCFFFFSNNTISAHERCSFYIMVHPAVFLAVKSNFKGLLWQQHHLVWISHNDGRTGSGSQ